MITISKTILVNVILWDGIRFFGCTARSNVAFDFGRDDLSPLLGKDCGAASVLEHRIRQQFNYAALCVIGNPDHERHFRDRPQTSLFKIVWTPICHLPGLVSAIVEYSDLMIVELQLDARTHSVSVSFNGDTVRSDEKSR